MGGGTHLVLPLWRRWRVNERQLHHRLPDACARILGGQLELNRLVQVRLPRGENGPVRPHAEERVGAPEGHGDVPRAVVEFHWRQTDETQREDRGPSARQSSTAAANPAIKAPPMQEEVPRLPLCCD